MIKIIFYLRGAKPIKNIYVRYRPNRYLDISIPPPTLSTPIIGIKKINATTLKKSSKGLNP